MSSHQLYLNRTYGNNHILKYIETKKFQCGRSNHVFLVRCLNCGKESKQNINSIRQCRKTCLACSKRKTKHGLYKTAIYRSWQLMLDRCYNKNTPYYKRYGGRGIGCIKKWHDFESFYKDMLPDWKHGLTLDRINNNKGYRKKNCRWATRKEQVRNRNNTLCVTHEGKTMPLGEWADVLGIKYGTLYHRYSRTGTISKK